MYSITTILTAVCVGLAVAMPAQTQIQATSTLTAPVVPSDSPAVDVKWTLDNVSRERTDDNKICEWKMAISQSPPFSPSIVANSTDAAVHCAFTVRTANDTDCGVVAFPRKRCSFSHHGFYVSGGHNGDGFMVVLVENLDEDTMAFFGYADDVLDSGDDAPPQTSPVTASYHAISSGTHTRRHSNDDDATPDDIVWTVKNMTRQIYTTGIISVDMKFTIHVGNNDPNPATCRIQLLAPEGVNPATWSWYDRQCDGSEYRVSWGYLASSDAGIMTLVSPEKNARAFFGFDNINMSKKLGSSGPSHVEFQNHVYEL